MFTKESIFHLNKLLSMMVPFEKTYEGACGISSDYQFFDQTDERLTSLRSCISPKPFLIQKSKTRGMTCFFTCSQLLSKIKTCIS